MSQAKKDKVEQKTALNVIEGFTPPQIESKSTFNTNLTKAIAYNPED